MPPQPMPMPTQGGLRSVPQPIQQQQPLPFYDDINEDDRFSVA